MPSLDEIVQIGETPVPGDSPGGESVRYEPEFEAISGEIAKLELPVKTEPDWAKVVADGTRLLAEKSKDYLLGAYVAQGLFETQGYPGLAAGLKLLIGMTRTFWDSGHPNRVRARNNALAWLGERGAPKVQERVPQLPQLDAVAGAKEAVDALIEIWLEKAEERPALSEMARYLEHHRNTLQAAKAKAEADAAARAAAPAAEAGAAPGEITDKLGAVKVIESATQAMGVARDFLAGEEPTLPLPYRLNRIAAWLFVEELPPNENGMTAVPGIAPDVPPACQETLQSGEYKELIGICEGRLAEFPLWLDQQRYVVQAMDGLGEDYALARDAVIGELAGLLRRLPGLAELSFDNGVPFADGETRTWIQSVVLPAGEGGAAQAADPREEVFQEARKLAAKGRWPQALSLFQESLNATGPRRERFLWKLSRARLCMEGGKPELALPQFQALDEEVRRLGLEDWEPSIALMVIKSTLQCWSRLGNVGLAAPQTEEAIVELKNRLARLDLVSALEMNGGP